MMPRDGFFGPGSGLLSWRGTAFLLLVAALIVAASLTARTHGGPAMAEASEIHIPTYVGCEDSKILKPFASFGDLEKYVAITNGSFEDGLTGWTVAKGSARVVEGTNPDGSEGNALRLGSDSKLVSPPICFDETRPHARMFVKKENDKQRLDTQVTYARFPSGKTEHAGVGRIEQDDVPAGSEWSPSPEIGTAIGELRKKFVRPDAQGRRWFQFVFETKGKGSWTIDDLYVDPRARN